MAFDTDHVFNNAADVAERGIRSGRRLQAGQLRARLRAAGRKISSVLKRATAATGNPSAAQQARRTQPTRYYS
jgi:hypothetical protein